MRRLPIYLLIDVSETISQDAVNEILRCVNKIIIEFQRIPFALETIDVSIITFASHIQTVVPITGVAELDLSSLCDVNLITGGKASPKFIFDYMMRDIDNRFAESSVDAKTNYPPITFLFSDKKVVML